MSDYGDACATMRGEVRAALAETAHATGIVHGPKAEAIVEAIIGKLHDRSTSWALHEIIDRPDTQS